MKSALSILFTFLFFYSYAQNNNYLDTTEGNYIYTQFESGIPNNLKDNFKNFNDAGLVWDEIKNDSISATITTAQHSTIIIEKENIGRVVLYASLRGDYHGTGISENKVTINFYKNGINGSEKFTVVKNFNEDLFQEIHENTRKAGINKVEIEFSTAGFFVVSKLKVVSLTESGKFFFGQLEMKEKSLEDLTENIKNESKKTSDKLLDHIDRIEQYNLALNNIIVGSKFSNIATLQSNSFNPFNNSNFKTEFDLMLASASDAEKEKIELAQKNLSDFTVKNITSNLDNIITGGKFSSLINIVDGMFNSTLSIQANDETVVKIDNKFYNKSGTGKTFKLNEIDDDETLSKINEITGKNEAFKTYIVEISKMLGEDLSTMNEIDKDIEVAKVLQQDLQNLLWEILSPLTDKPIDSVIYNLNGDLVKTSEIHDVLSTAFDFDRIANDVTNFQKIREHAISNTDEVNKLQKKYTSLVSKIKTNYDLMYEIRPAERKNKINSLESISADIRLEWNTSQDKIIAAYLAEPDGVKYMLSTMTKIN